VPSFALASAAVALAGVTFATVVFAEHVPFVHIEPNRACGTFEAIVGGPQLSADDDLVLHVSGPFRSEVIPLTEPYSRDPVQFRVKLGPYTRTGIAQAVARDAATGSEIAKAQFVVYCPSVVALSTLVSGRPTQGPVCGEFTLRGTGFRPDASVRIWFERTTRPREQVGKPTTIPPPPTGDFSVTLTTEGIPNQIVEVFAGHPSAGLHTTLTVQCPTVAAPQASVTPTRPPSAAVRPAATLAPRLPSTSTIESTP